MVQLVPTKNQIYKNLPTNFLSMYFLGKKEFKPKFRYTGAYISQRMISLTESSLIQKVMIDEVKEEKKALVNPWELRRTEEYNMKVNWDDFVIEWDGPSVFRALVETPPITLRTSDIKETVTLENYAMFKCRFIGIIANRIKRQLNLRL